MNRIVLPGATLGVLGGGQLGRMFAIAARRMGYRVHTLSPGFDTPTGQVADVEIDADYDDLDAIRAFARGVDVITFEFENVTTAAADAAAEIVPVRPSGHALHVCQQRAREKAFLRLKGFPVTPFESVESLEELATAVERVGLPAILKTAVFGYDGKGQHRITSALDLEPVWGLVGHQTAVLERVVDFVLEFSVVAARGLDGAFVHYGAIENTHREHILDLSVAPARMPPAGGGRSGGRDAGDHGGAGLRRRAVRGVLPHRRRQGAGQRDRAAATQLRPPDHRRVRHQPVRAAGAGDVRPAARRPPVPARRRDVEPARRRVEPGRAALGRRPGRRPT